MTQIVFLTLFLGLTMGRQPVGVHVTGPVARVELLLDGQSAAVLTREPWARNVDFGNRLLPHRLVARALDAQGNELARVEQRVNAPRATSEASLAIDGKTARLVWQSLDSEKPKEVHWTFDGARLPSTSLRVTIPNYDPEKPHLLRAVASPTAGRIVEAEQVLGGALNDTAGAALTPVPVSFATPDAELANVITVNGAPATIVAVEKLPADIIFVRDPSLSNFAFRIDLESRNRAREGFDISSGGDAIPLGRKQGTRFIWPVATRTKGTGEADLFPSSRTFMVADGPSMRMILGSVSAPGAEELRYADAVAVAGLQAAASRRPRAVVLIVGGKYQDWSRLAPQQARDYLASVGVPFYVWTAGGTVPESWGAPRRVDGAGRVTSAAAALLEEVQRQRIVWIAGDHMLDEIAINGAGVKPLWTVARRP